MEFLHLAPRLSPHDACVFVADRFGMTVTASPLSSERDQAFWIRNSDNREFVLKIANRGESRDLVEDQQRLMTHLGDLDFVQQLVPDTDGSVLSSVEHDQHRYLAQLMTWLPGTPLGETRRHTQRLFADLGDKLGQMDAALTDFSAAALKRDLHWDLAHGAAQVDLFVERLVDPTTRQQVNQILELYHRRVSALLPELRRSVIHSDANDFNVICSNQGRLQERQQSISGIVDFGDAVHSFTICNLAIAIAYAVLDKGEPLEIAATMSQAYDTRHPLDDVEVEVLWPMILLRLAVSVCLAAAQTAERPDDPYLNVSQKPILNTLPALLATPHEFATATLRHATGRPPIHTAQAVMNYIEQTDVSLAPLMGEPMTTSNTFALDLSVWSELIEGDPGEPQTRILTKRLEEQLREHAARFAIGRYAEPRLLYTRDMFAGDGGLLGERRTLHVGLDIFAAAGHAVHTPLAGMVHSVRASPEEQDYGHVVIVAHSTPDGQGFWTLYGHLSSETLSTLSVGQSVAAGQRIAALGDVDENGGWPPHLHFQIITHLLGETDEFAGVGTARSHAIWRSLSPEPYRLAGVPLSIVDAISTSPEHSADIRRQRLGVDLADTYTTPVRAVRGWGAFIWDDDGRKYLDGFHGQALTGGRGFSGLLDDGMESVKRPRCESDKIGLHSELRTGLTSLVSLNKCLKAIHERPNEIILETVSSSDDEKEVARLIVDSLRERGLLLGLNQHPIAGVRIAPSTGWQPEHTSLLLESLREAADICASLGD